MSAGSHLPTHTVAPASAMALAIANPKPASSAMPATKALFPLRSIGSMAEIEGGKGERGKGNRDNHDGGKWDKGHGNGPCLRALSQNPLSLFPSPVVLPFPFSPFPFPAPVV